MHQNDDYIYRTTAINIVLCGSGTEVLTSIVLAISRALHTWQLFALSPLEYMSNKSCIN